MEEHYVLCEGGKLCFTLPEDWKVLSEEDKPLIPGVKDFLAEVKRALDNPIGSPKLEEIAKPGMEVALLFDDLQRPTPVNLVIPEMLNRLNHAGIPDDRNPPRLLAGRTREKGWAGSNGSPEGAARFPRSPLP
jgi:nickel-dependent lactate racemase